MTTELSQLLPTNQQRVMDLVEAAGLDVSDWGNFAGGLSKAASNPKYCYEWAFFQPTRAVVANLWHRELQDDTAGVFIVMQLKNGPEIKGVRRTRIERLHEALLNTRANDLPLRVIVNAGAIIDHETEDAPGARVSARLLDPLPWHVSSYDGGSGTWTLRRGPGPTGCIDQFENPVVPEVERHTSVTMSFVRDPKVRRDALQRARGRCEYCGELGFVMLDAKIFLETHHVVQLSAGGPDIGANVAALCPNHHREAHLGANALKIKAKLQNQLGH